MQVLHENRIIDLVNGYHATSHSFEVNHKYILKQLRKINSSGQKEKPREAIDDQKSRLHYIKNAYTWTCKRMYMRSNRIDGGSTLHSIICSKVEGIWTRNKACSVGKKKG